MKQCTSITIALMMFGSLAAGAVHADVGRVPATSTVNANGGFEYTIPIELPPGPNGVEPHLALVYDSSVDATASDGMPLAGTTDVYAIPAGAGWLLEGLSMIERTDKTVADNGTASPVSYTPGDAYEVDGHMLRLTGATAAGETGATYQTQVDDFTKYTVYESNGYGPGYWVAQTKSGLTYDYGKTSNSTIQGPLPNGGQATTAWLLNKVSDAYGNLSITHM